MALTTQERVLRMSAKLFNLYGVEAVSIGQISEALEISPGNFTYYYAKKANLLDCQFRIFEERLKYLVDNFPIHERPRDFAQALYELMDLVFSYRFLFLGASYLNKNDLIKAARYERLASTIKIKFIAQFKQLIVEGYVTPIKSPYSVELLVDSIWWQWLGWLLAMQIAQIKKASTRQLVTDGMINIMFLNQHYANRVVFRAIRIEIQKIARRSSPGPSASAVV